MRLAMLAHLTILAPAVAAAGAADAPPPSATLLSIPAVSSDRFESHPAFDPRSGDLYFVRSSPQFQGWRIWRSRCLAGGYAAPEAPPFSGAGVEADPFITPDGRRLYFISSRADPPAKTGDDLDIWTAERSASGEWGSPVRLPAPVNSPGAEWFPRLNRRGRLYFGSDRPGGHGATDIYVAEREGRSWRVENLGGAVSTAADEYEFEPARNGHFAILMADGRLFRIERRRGHWEDRTPLATGAAGFHVGPLLSPSGRTLLFARPAPPHSGELFRLPLGGAAEDWPAGCPRRSSRR